MRLDAPAGHTAAKSPEIVTTADYNKHHDLVIDTLEAFSAAQRRLLASMVQASTAQVEHSAQALPKGTVEQMQARGVLDLELHLTGLGRIVGLQAAHEQGQAPDPRVILDAEEPDDTKPTQPAVETVGAGAGWMTRVAKAAPWHSTEKADTHQIQTAAT